MIRKDIIFAFAVAILGLANFGCRSCGCGSEEGKPKVEGAPAGTGSEAAPQEQPSGELRREGGGGDETAKSDEEAETLGASCLGLPLKDCVVAKTQTRKAFSFPDNEPNPHNLKETRVALLDVDDPLEHGEDLFDVYVAKLFKLVNEQKILSEGAPLAVYWEPFSQSKKPKISVAVPVPDNVELKPPLRPYRFGQGRVHREAFNDGDEVMRRFGPKDESEKKQIALSGRTIIRNMAKALNLTVKPDIVLIRLPGVSPAKPEALSKVQSLEFLFVESSVEAQTN